MPYEQIQAREMMSPLEGYSQRQWADIDPEEKKRLIKASKKAHEEKELPDFKTKTGDSASLVGTTGKGKTVLQAKSKVSELFDKADQMKKE
jgi:hypothetical protein